MPGNTHCANFPCEKKLPEIYYRVVRVIRKGNLKRGFTFCSIKCMKEYLEKMTPIGNETI